MAAATSHYHFHPLVFLFSPYVCVCAPVSLTFTTGRVSSNVIPAGVISFISIRDSIHEHCVYIKQHSRAVELSVKYIQADTQTNAVLLLTTEKGNCRSKTLFERDYTSCRNSCTSRNRFQTTANEDTYQVHEKMALTLLYRLETNVKNNLCVINDANCDYACRPHSQSHNKRIGVFVA